MFLLDTNVISQRPKPTPHPAVMAWLQRTPDSLLRISAITIQEIRFGAASLPPSRKRTHIEAWLEQDILRNFADRILPVDAVVADACGRLLAEQKRKNYTPAPSDALIAATAIVHGLTIATLNRKHFEPLGVALVRF